ncbi:MAG: hypothetical protein ACLQL2_11500 [Methylovirgula sp.]
MFWDAYLDFLRNALSNDLGEWIVASLLVAILVTKFLSVSGLNMEFRQELSCCATIFLMLFGVFYLP